MENQSPALYEIRAARCFIEDRGVFLRTIQNIGRDYDTHIVCFNADMMAGRVHAEAAVQQAARSFSEGTAISNTFEMEALLYAAGSRQCTIAASFGIQPGENHIYVCCFPTRKGLWTALKPFLRFVKTGRDPMDARKKARLMVNFDIPAAETGTQDRDRITDLVLERVALLNVNR
jgi:KEOPS complex subunit Cgi121